MTETALRALFDYAGMFPPAAKSLSLAVQESGRFPATLQRPGLVGADLVLSPKDWRMLDTGKLARTAFGQRPCKLALVSIPLEKALPVARAAGAQNARPASDTPVVSLEVHAEGDLDLPLVAQLVAAAGVPVYVEPRWPAARVRSEVAAVARDLARVGAGLKVRCAGATALDRPALAAAVQAAADAGIPFKATQGLHHPMPRDGFPHGFLGLLAAVRLRQAHGARFPDVLACLAEPDAAAFRFTDGIAWRDFHVASDTLAGLPPFAIGSCSLQEPDDDLMALWGPAEN